MDLLWNAFIFWMPWKKLSFSIIYVIIIIYKYFESACIFIFYILIF